jgi:biotin carboxyl carrier protein
MTNAPTKKFRATVDDASFDVDVTGDVVRVHRADAVSGQPGSNPQPREQDTPPSSKKQLVEPTGTPILASPQFTITVRGHTLDVRQMSAGASSTSSASHATGAPPSDAGTATQSRDSTDIAGVPTARAFVATANDVTWVCIDGEVFTIELEDAQRMRRPRAASGEGLSAPMPATVIRVIAEPGREVKRGETLLLLEAMKMELPVRAPRDGKVKALHCQAGQLVQPGVPLVDLE